LMKEGKTFAEICDAMADEFDAPRAQIVEDFRALMSQLIEQKLIIPQEE